MLQFLQNNFGTVLLAIVSGAMLFWSFFGNRILGIKEADHLAAMQLINHKDGLMLDVREKSEYDSGHVLNSKHIPLGKLGERLGELEKYRSRPIVVICRSGQRSASACSLLGKKGFEQVFNFNGGINAWQKANLPLER